MIESVANIQAMFLNMAQDREITGEVGRVLYYFFGKLDFENYIHVAQTDIAYIAADSPTAALHFLWFPRSAARRYT